MKHLTTALLAIFAFVMASCEHKPLILPEEGMARVRIVFDWSNIDPEDVPEEMAIYFYDSERHSYLRQVSAKSTAPQVVNLPAEEYQLVTYNRNDNINSFTTDSWMNHVITLNEAAQSLTSTVFGETTTIYRNPVDFPLPLSEQPAVIVGQAMRDVSVHPAEGEEVVVTIVPRYLTARYDVTLRNFHIDRNLARVGAGVLSGTNGTLMPVATAMVGQCRPSAPSPLVSVPFLLQWGEGSAVATSTFLTYGAPDDQPQYLYVYIWSDADSFLTRVFDVTDIIRQAPDPMHVSIVLDFNGGGTTEGNNPYLPEVDGWEEVEEEIHA